MEEGRRFGNLGLTPKATPCRRCAAAEAWSQNAFQLTGAASRCAACAPVRPSFLAACAAATFPKPGGRSHVWRQEPRVAAHEPSMDDDKPPSGRATTAGRLQTGMPSSTRPISRVPLP